MSRPIEKSAIWASMLIGAILPVTLGFALSDAFPGWRWSHYPLHAMVESAGAVSALTIATLIVIMVNSKYLPDRFIVVSAALIGMGLLDGLHAVLYVSISFVWLHSVATLVGGIIFSAVWLPERWLTKKRQKILLITIIIVALSGGMISIAMPDSLPAMIVNDQFSLIAKILNIAGGMGFLVGAAYFIYDYYQTNYPRIEGYKQTEDIVFANHCLLLGIAGLLFEASVLWDIGWWWWHILRFFAYFIVLIYFFVLFNRSQRQLRRDELKLKSMNNQLEQRVQARTSELEKSSKAKSEFLSSMSHELRTPLNAILGFGQLLELDTKDLNDIQKDNVSEILVAGHHLLHLINGLLDLSKIEAGKLEVSMEEVSIDKMLTQCIAMIGPDAAVRQIKLVDLVSERGYKVYADPVRLKQVLLNLLSNAVKYNVESGEIVLDSNIIDKQRLRICVTDTGPGLNDEAITRLFTPFARLDVADNIEGTGIGLVISRKLARAMHGDIGVVSEPDKGSTFWLELSLAHTV